MDIPSLRTWIDDEIVTPEMLNEQVRDALTFLLNPPAAAIQAGANQSIANNTWTRLTFPSLTTQHDSDAMTDAANGRLNINTTGLYLVNAQIVFNTVATGTVRRRYSRINKSSTDVAAEPSASDNRESGAFASTRPVSNLTGLIRATAGESLYLWAYQDSGGAVDAVGGVAGERIKLSARWVGL